MNRIDRLRVKVANREARAVMDQGLRTYSLAGVSPKLAREIRLALRRNGVVFKGRTYLRITTGVKAS